ncbi:UNVERIFIED_CONTAM: hypothetical protein Sradi_5269500 [Sesamum radiatum]|uniref:SWIM-type domain-containing protein n=1 Tax=Sesamum radiatum TaxID=300843 RepID=A0AAW2LP20_SESRA
MTLMWKLANLSIIEPRNKVNDMLYGKYKDQYTRLYDYCEELRVSNPGSTVVMKTEVDEDSGVEMFLRLYICLDACKRGYLEGCRPVIGLDGCHLKGPHKGVLLSAVGIDPNNCIFPICYCVAETRTKTLGDGSLKSFSMILAFYDLLPEVEHRFCVRHMYSNFKKVHSGLALKDKVWKLAKTSTVNRFKAEMESLKNFNEGAHARNKPLLGMLETIRIYLQKRLQSRRDTSVRWHGPLCPKVQKVIEKLKNDTRTCISTYAGGSKFEVRDMYGGQNAVDINMKTCSCRRRKLTGIPCVHAVSAIVSCGRIPEDYVHNCYSIETFKKAYSFIINPVRGQTEWPETGKGPVAPNSEIRLPGRPKKVRRREPDEPAPSTNKNLKLRRVGQKTLSCSKCHREGHNKRKCPTVDSVTPVVADTTRALEEYSQLQKLASKTDN